MIHIIFNKLSFTTHSKSGLGLLHTGQEVDSILVVLAKHRERAIDELGNM